MALVFESVILLFSASTVVFKPISYIRMYIINYDTMCMQPEVGDPGSYFNGGSHYKYNYTGIDYIKLSASVYRNVWKPPYNK